MINNARVAGHLPEPAEFRAALSHYATGVAVVTSYLPGAGPVGMVVGTFTSVSLDPPLVGFLPAKSSYSWSLIRQAGSFCINVLGADQAHICRAFVAKDTDRFNAYAWEATISGSPRLAEALLWVDCDLESITDAGDHDFVLGRVRDLGVNSAGGLPLLFLRGGYGAPVLPFLAAKGAAFGPRLRLAEQIRPVAESIAHDLGIECLIGGCVDDEVVVLAAAGTGRSSFTLVGASFPLAAPLGSELVAWASEAEQHRWLERGRKLTGVDSLDFALEDLAHMRRLGYSVTTGREVAESLERLAFGDATDSHEMQAVLQRLCDKGPETGLRCPIEEVRDITSMHVPICGLDGEVLLSFDLVGFNGSEGGTALRRCLDRLMDGAMEASRQLRYSRSVAALAKVE
jgi:flavin reductase (DIM6/NTAB) family NADH-FMN oxidoreductase RutF